MAGTILNLFVAEIMRHADFWEVYVALNVAIGIGAIIYAAMAQWDAWVVEEEEIEACLMETLTESLERRGKMP